MVRLAFLFGSRALGHARDDSDFDVAVLVDEDLAGPDRGETIRALAARLGREVSSTLLDLVILNDAPALLRHRVLRDGVVIFERSPEERVRFSIQTLRDYQDGYIRREAFRKRRIQKLQSGASHGGPSDLLEKARGAARLLEKAERVSRR
jgi:predicted nucleotidyltransferase